MPHYKKYVIAKMHQLANRVGTQKVANNIVGKLDGDELRDFYQYLMWVEQEKMMAVNKEKHKFGPY